MQQGIQFDSPIGAISAFCTECGISRIHIRASAGSNLTITKGIELLDQCRRQMNEYFAGQRKIFDLLLAWSILTSFQADVLRVTHKIPYGEVLTYGEIATRLGKPASSRAVGGALARNPLPILIPCHRVVSASGHLTGFSAADGINAKAWLLQLEGHRVDAQKLA